MSGGGRWQGSTRKARLPRNWPAIRSRILKRDGGVCHVCLGPGADGVDHLVAGDDHSDSNLAAIHHNVAPFCHRGKSSREGGQASARRPKERREVETHPGLIR
jgi:5-methylcytosine-specific restriction enzyme A